MFTSIMELFSPVELVGAFWLGYLLFNKLKSHPNWFHLDQEHLFMVSAIPVCVLLFIVASPWMFALAFIGASKVVIAIMATQFALFILGLMKIIHYGFLLLGKKTT